MQELHTGELFANRYRLGKLLGKGGMGQVFLAFDTMLGDERIALKILHSSLVRDEKHTKRFLREVTLTRKVTHPNVVRTFDVGAASAGNLFLTMEYVEGLTLRQRMQQGVVEPLECARIIMEIARGLAAVHEQEIVHRDLKPGNVMLLENGGVKIADFGVARPESSDITAHDEVVGSTPYMSPEIWLGKKIGPASDLYALGIIAYEIVTAHLPFDGDSPAEVMCKHLESNPYPPQEVVGGIPIWFNTLILKMLAKDPIRRPSSATEVANIIQENLIERRDTTTSSTNLVVDASLLNSFMKSDAVQFEPPPKPQITEKPVLLESSHAVRGQAPLSDTRQYLDPKERSTTGVTVKSYKRGLIGQRNIITPSHSDRTNASEGWSVLAKMERRVWYKAQVKYWLLVSVFISAYIWIGTELLGSLLHNHWRGGDGSLGLIITVAAIGFSAAFYPTIAALPVLLLGSSRRGIRSAFKAWWKLSLSVGVISFIFFIYHFIFLTVANVKAGIKIGPSEVHEMVEKSSENAFQVALLFPLGTPYQVGMKYSAPALVKAVDGSILASFLYFILLAVYVVLLSKVIKLQINGADDDRNQFVTRLLLQSVAALVFLECLLRGYISDIFGWHTLRVRILEIGPYVFQFTEYGMACAVINWSIIFIMVTFVIPFLAYQKREVRF